MGYFQAKKAVYDFSIKNSSESRESLEKDLETWLKIELEESVMDLLKQSIQKEIEDLKSQSEKI